MTLGTADASGLPWVTPVWYAHEEYGELFWVSSPDARHSRNLAQRPELSIVIFDSGAAVGTGQGVYMSAVAAEQADADLERGMAIFTRRSQAQGARAWTQEDVRPPAQLRLYRAAVSEHWVLAAGSGPDRRIAVNLELEAT